MLKRVNTCVIKCGITEICHQAHYDNGYCMGPLLRESALFEEQKELRVMVINTNASKATERSLLDDRMTLLLVGNLKRVTLETLMNLQYALQDIKRSHRLPEKDFSLLSHITTEITRRINETRADRDSMGKFVD